MRASPSHLADKLLFGTSTATTVSQLEQAIWQGRISAFRLVKVARREGEAVGLKPFRASKESAISRASTNPTPLVSSPRQRSAGRGLWRGLWRGELANRHRDQRTISHPESSVPPLPDPPHQSGLIERDKKTLGLRRFLKFETPGETCSKTEMCPGATSRRNNSILVSSS